jgi:type VI protein secretion system component VasK
MNVRSNALILICHCQVAHFYSPFIHVKFYHVMVEEKIIILSYLILSYLIYSGYVFWRLENLDSYLDHVF